MKLNFKLTKEQKKHLKSIQWLLSSKPKDRRSGRSMLLAYVYILEALNQKEYRKIEIIDHPFIVYGDLAKYTNKFLANYINEIIKENNLPLQIKWSTLRLFKKVK